jgi:MtrB/PioB family decaheme-associated outer membrane protein
MKIHSPLNILGALGLLCSTSAWAVDTSAWTCESCPYPKGLSGSVEAGVGNVSDKAAKFGTTTGLQRKGAYAVLGGTATLREADGLYADLEARDLGLNSRSLSVYGGREGVVALGLRYDEIPRYFGDGSQTPFLGAGGGNLTLPTGFAAPGTNTMPLAANLQPIDVGYVAKRLDLTGSWLGTDSLNLRMGYRRDVRDGTRPLYASFLATAAQLPAPVDHVTDVLDLTAAYTAAQWQASLSYQWSQFRNGTSSLTWDNPFTAVVPGANRGQLALAPDNELHQIIGSAGYQIAPTIRASADFAIGRLTQNQGFLAPTLNASLTPGPMPAASLDGKVDSFNGSVRITAAPLDGLRLNASYARDVRDNRTARLAYPYVETDISAGLPARTNTPFSHWQDRFKLQADYRGPATLRLAGGAEYEQRERNYTEVVKTRETTVWGRVSVQPIAMLGLSLKLSHADRDHSTYGTAVWFGAPENPLLRKYNLAARLRDSAGVRVDLTLSETLSLGLSADHANDDYHRSVIGLTESRSGSAGVDVAWAFAENTRLHAFAQGESIRSLQTGSQSVGLPDWTGRSKDRFEVVGFGIKHAAIPDKLDLGADFSSSRSRSDIDVQTVMTEPAFPRASTALDRVKLHASYKLDDKISLAGTLWHERYKSVDWRTDGIAPATLVNLLSLGTQTPAYKVNAVSVSLRYRF